MPNYIMEEPPTRIVRVAPQTYDRDLMQLIDDMQNSIMVLENEHMKLLMEIEVLKSTIFALQNDFADDGK